MAARSAEFIENYLKLLEENYEHFSLRCYEFVSGGDSLYTGGFPVSEKDWKNFSREKQADLAEKHLNVPALHIRYPGTENGPYSPDLRIFHGLDKLASLTGDFMMVESYAHLLQLKNLDHLCVDTYAHTLGYIHKTWTVFDALIFSHEYERRYVANVRGILKYKQELKLDQPFDFYPEEPKLQVPAERKNWDGWDEWETLLKKTITREFLYKNFAQ